MAEESRKPRRIAFFLPNLGGGGAERVALATARDLIDHGHDVDLVLIRAVGELLPLLPKQANVVDLNAPRILAALRPLVRYLRLRRPDALHALMWPVTIIAILAHRLARSRALLMVSDHTTLSRHVRGWRQRAFARWSTRLLYPIADVRVVCSAQAADDLADLSGLSRDGFQVIHNPIAVPPTIATSPDVEQLWGGSSPRIITVGSLKEEKNHALLLRAFARLEGLPNARLMILGEGPLRPRLEVLARELNIADRVLMPGFALDPWPYLASSDLFVLSSDHEGFGLALVEAMHAGLKVVSTDCASGPAEILAGGRYGRLVPCGDVPALAEAIRDGLRESREPDRMRARAAEMTGSSKFARYAELLTGPTAPRPGFASDPLVAQIFRGSLTSMTVRIVGLLLAFVSHLLLSRTMGAQQYGSFVIALGWALVLVIPARLGLDNAALRFATIYREEGNFGALRGLILFSLLAIAAASAALSLPLLVAKAAALPIFRNVPSALMLWVVALIFPLAALGWMSALVRTAQKIFASQFYEQVLRPVALIFGIGAFAVVGRRLDAPGAMALTVIGAVIAAIGILVHARTTFGEVRGRHADLADRGPWLSVGWTMLLITVLQEILNQTEVLALGLLASAADAGHFSAAARLASLVPFGLVAIVTVSGPLIALAHRRGEMDELARIARLNSRFSFLFALLVAAILALFGRQALEAFGPGFDAAYPALLVLLAGGLVNAFTGSVGYLLLMTGRQTAALLIIFLGLSLSILLNALLIPLMGVLGSAIASSAALIFWNLSMLFYVRRVLGVDASAFGVRRRTVEAVG